MFKSTCFSACPFQCSREEERYQFTRYNHNGTEVELILFFLFTHSFATACLLSAPVTTQLPAVARTAFFSPPFDPSYSITECVSDSQLPNSRNFLPALAIASHHKFILLPKCITSTSLIANTHLLLQIVYLESKYFIHPQGILQQLLHLCVAFSPSLTSTIPA